MSFWITMSVMALVIVVASLLFRKLNKPIVYVIPSGLAILSLVLIIIAFVSNLHTVLGYSAALFMASAVALILTTIINHFNSNSMDKV